MIQKSDIYQETNSYDCFQIPPDLGFAYKHQLAKSVGFIYHDKIDLKKCCPCCNLPVEKEIIGLCINIDKLAFLGQCYPQYFFSIKLYNSLLIVICAIVSVYNIITTANACYGTSDIDILSRKGQNKGCFQFMGIMYSLNKTENQLTIQAILTLIGTFISCFGLIVIKFMQKKLISESQEYEVTASDYTILIKNMNPFTTLQNIKAYFANYYLTDQKVQNLENCNLEIVKNTPEIDRIFFASQIENYMNWKKEKVFSKIFYFQTIHLLKLRQLWSQLKTVEELKMHSNDLEKIKLDIQQFENKIKNFEEQIQLKGDQLRTRYCFVTFSRESDLFQVLQIARESFREKILINAFTCYGSLFCIKKKNYPLKFLNGAKITIFQAPDPLDIQWENLHVSEIKKFIRNVFSIFSSLIVIALGYIILYGISYSQKKIQDAKGLGAFFSNYILSFFCALLILIINLILNYLVKESAKLERHATYTSELRQSTILLIIMQFINTALVPFGLFIFNRSDFNQEDLMANLFFVFIGNMILVPLELIFEPFYLLRLIKRKRIKEEGFRCQLTQQNAHEIFEGPQFEIAESYALINKSILTATFYMCIFPYGSIMEIIALGAYYWASKYILLRRCSWPINLSERLQISIYQLMTCLPVALSTGGFCYEYVLLEKEINLSIYVVSIIVAVVGMILLNCYGFHTKTKNVQIDSEREDILFIQKRIRLPTDYDRSNPITRVQALQELNQIWIQQGQKGKVIEANVLQQNQRILQNYHKALNNNMAPEQLAVEENQKLNQQNLNENMGIPYQNEFQRRNFQISSAFTSKFINNKRDK